MVTQERINILIQTIIGFFVLIAGAEYFKYSTQANYNWFHCTPQVVEISDSSILEVTSIGGPSCDKRGQVKSITKRIVSLFDPNIEPVIFCIKEDGDKIFGYGAKLYDEELLSTYCNNIIHW